MSERRPENCRNRLRDEGQSYPKSGCASCHTGGMTGCHYERTIDVSAIQTCAITSETLAKLPPDVAAKAVRNALADLANAVADAQASGLRVSIEPPAIVMTSLVGAKGTLPLQLHATIWQEL